MAFETMTLNPGTSGISRPFWISITSKHGKNAYYGQK
jgi:hypothetical protein